MSERINAWYEGMNDEWKDIKYSLYYHFLHRYFFLIKNYSFSQFFFLFLFLLFIIFLFLLHPHYLPRSSNVPMLSSDSGLRGLLCILLL